MISRLSISGFRGMSDVQIGISPRTAIIGANGSGKTHILEAIHLASGGHLHYFQGPREEFYQLELIVSDAIGPKSFCITRNQGREECRIQGGKLSSVKYRENLPYRTVFLSPFDMNLLYFAPSIRRDYIDSILSRTFAQFPKVKRDYDAIMRQRNALLKKIRDQEAERKDLDYWDRTFAEKAMLYHTYRWSFVSFVGDHVSVFHSFLPKYSLQFSYVSKLVQMEDVESGISQYLFENRERDILTGHTHIGPHLDDFTFFLDFPDSRPSNSDETAIDAAMMLSRGETKVVLLALKQLEILFLKKHLKSPIILLFDDIFAELDQNYAEHVIDIFDVDQVVLTTQRALPVSKKWDDFSCINLNLQ